MPAAKKDTTYQAKETVHIGEWTFKQGEYVNGSHEVFKTKDYVHLFEPVEDVVARNVEQATAAPGEKRA